MYFDSAGLSLVFSVLFAILVGVWLYVHADCDRKGSVDQFKYLRNFLIGFLSSWFVFLLYVLVSYNLPVLTTHVATGNVSVIPVYFTHPVAQAQNVAVLAFKDVAENRLVIVNIYQEVGGLKEGDVVNVTKDCEGPYGGLFYHKVMKYEYKGK